MMRILPVLLVGVLVASCSTSAQPVPKQTATDVVASVGTKTITLADVDEQALQQASRTFGDLPLLRAVYEARRMTLEEMVAKMLFDQEAKVRGVEETALIEQEVTSKVTPPTEADVVAWFQANQQRVQGRPLEQVRTPIHDLLTQERTQAARQAYIDRLKGKTSVRMMLQVPPTPPPRRMAVKAADGPARGPAGAPIEIIEFSDFQCPYCQRAQPAVKQVLSTFGDRVRLVYRNYPLVEIHPNARPAAEAAQCANEQGKFWPYHDRLFTDTKKLSDADLKQGAAELGLDSARFNACVDSHKFKSLVDADIRDGNAVGVSGTPAFFINGRMIVGAQPFEEFKRIIDEELELKKR